jgi:hypothetical protein
MRYSTPPPQEYDWVDVLALLLITGSAWGLAHYQYHHQVKPFLDAPLTLRHLQAYGVVLVFTLLPLGLFWEHRLNYLRSLLQWQTRHLS